MEQGKVRLRPQRTEDYCYEALRRAILEGRLLPNQRLVEVELARTFGVGRAAVRTALVRLEQEGIVQREPNRGARVRLVTEQEAVEILEARAALECLTVRYAARRATPEDLRQLREILCRMEVCRDRGDPLGYSELNHELHHVLLRIAGHATAARLIDMLQVQNVRYRYRTVLFPGRLGESLEEHRAVVEAVATGDPDAAEAAMRHHLKRVIEAMHQAAQMDRVRWTWNPS
ncbi:MAG: GntR family transcriptional regulator [Armatimonadetes bacterium]|nr:GntR family transcriptional regulator [Armatimonadota bacterium]MDW8154896.1 GntR family transcriptional regulator [Armatimonadota bacterium]